MHVHWMWGSLNARGQVGGTPCQFVSHTPPASRKKAKVSVIKRNEFLKDAVNVISHRINIVLRRGFAVSSRLSNANQSASPEITFRDMTQATSNTINPQSA